MIKSIAFVPIAKIDEAKRLVSGVLAEEAVDKSAEIMDYAKSKPNFEAWSKSIEKASGGKSKGNLREMHTPSAVGKLTDITFDDDAKTVGITAKVVDDNAWRKVVEGVYTGFSVGGSYGDRSEVGGVLKYVAKPTEASLADNPCMYGATFEIVKADGAKTLRKFVGIEHTPTEIVVDVTEVALKHPNDLNKILDHVREVVGADAFAKVDIGRITTESTGTDDPSRVRFLLKIAPAPLTKVVEERDGMFVVVIDGEDIGDPYETEEAANEALAAIEAEEPDADEGDADDGEGDDDDDDEEAAKAAHASVDRLIKSGNPILVKTGRTLKAILDTAEVTKDAHAAAAVINADEAIEQLKAMIANMALLPGEPDTWALGDIIAAVQSAIWAKDAAEFAASQETTPVVAASPDDVTADADADTGDTLAMLAGAQIVPMLKAAKIEGDALDTFSVDLLKAIMGGREIALGAVATLEATTDEGYLATLEKVSTALVAVKDALDKVSDDSLTERIETATADLTKSVEDLATRVDAVAKQPAQAGRKIKGVDKTLDVIGGGTNNPVATATDALEKVIEAARASGATKATLEAMRVASAAAIMPKGS